MQKVRVTYKYKKKEIHLKVVNHVDVPYHLAVDFAPSRHASEVIQQRCEERVLPSVHACCCGPDALQTGRLTCVRQIEDAVGRGAIRRLVWDLGHCVGNSSRDCSQRGHLSLIRLCERGRHRVWGIQRSSAVD